MDWALFAKTEVMLACTLIILVETSLAYLEVSFIWESKVSLQICLPRESYNSAKNRRELFAKTRKYNTGWSENRLIFKNNTALSGSLSSEQI
jgi:hypothetical protein